MKKKLFALLGIMLSLSLISYGVVKVSQTETGKEDDYKVVTSFYPMYIATLNITEGVEGVSVTNLTNNQTGCLHDYQLTTKDMKTLSDADVVIMNGGEVELFMEDVIASYADLDVIVASEGITFLEGSEHDHSHETESGTSDDAENGVLTEDISLTGEYAEANSTDDYDHDHTEDETATGEAVTEDDHDHEDDHPVDETVTEDDHDHAEEETVTEDDHDHEHSEINGHVWLNMDLYLIQIDNIANGLAAADPDNAKIYLENANDYKAKIMELKEELESTLASLAGDEVIAFHDAFAYLAQELGMEVVATVEIEADTSLSAGEIAEVVDEINLHHIKYLFTEEQYSTSIASSIAAETDASVYVIDSLVTGPDNKDAYINGMRQNIETLKELLP